MTKGAQTKTCPFLDKSRNNQTTTIERCHATRGTLCIVQVFTCMRSDAYIRGKQTSPGFSRHIFQHKTRLVHVTSLRPVYYESAHSTHLSISMMADIVWATFSKNLQLHRVSNNAKSLHEDTSVSTTTVWDAIKK